MEPASIRGSGSIGRNNYEAIHQKYVVKGLLAFVLISLVAFIILFLINDSVELVEVLQQLRLRYVVALLVLVAADAYLDASRYFVLVRRINPFIRFRVVFESNMADSFGGAITPFQAGGGPAMLFMMNRRGIDIAKGLSIIVATFVMSLTFLLCASLVSVFLFRYRFANMFLHHLLTYSVLAFAVILSSIILSLFLPQKSLERAIIHCTERIRPSNRIVVSSLRSIVSLLRIVSGYVHSCRQLVISHPKALVSTFVVTVLYYCNRFLLAYCLVYALGGASSVSSIITTQSLILFLPYFAPTPGGSGFTEISINGLMSDMLSGGILFSFTLLYRCVLSYTYVIIGGIVIAKELRYRMGESRGSFPMPI